jgi:hypothetical protein
MELCHWITAHPKLLSVILFTDEASFTWDGINYSRNMLTWSNENPHETRVSNFQRRFSVNVYCGVLGNRLIGPFVLHNNLTGNAYEAFLRNELTGLLEHVPLMVRSQIYFQHDGALPHYTRHVREYLDESCPNCWLGCGWPVAWAPRSPDLTPLDYYFWGHMKTLVYESSTARSYFCSAWTHTQPSRQRCFCSVPAHACRKLLSNWRRTLLTITVCRYCILLYYYYSLYFM